MVIAHLGYVGARNNAKLVVHIGGHSEKREKVNNCTTTARVHTREKINIPLYNMQCALDDELHN